MRSGNSSELGKKNKITSGKVSQEFIVLTHLLSTPVGVVCIFEPLELNVTNILRFKTIHFQILFLVNDWLLRSSLIEEVFNNLQPLLLC